MIHPAHARQHDGHEDNVADQKNSELISVGISHAGESQHNGVGSGHDGREENERNWFPTEDRSQRRAKPAGNITHQDNDESRHKHGIYTAIDMRDLAAVSDTEQ